jgi:RecB family exonuclease
MAKYKLSPSASSRFLTCSASLPLNTGFSESENTLKGSLQHEVAYLRLKEHFFLEDNSERIEQLRDTNNWFVSSERPNLKVKWDKDFDRTVDNYIDYVKSIENAYKPKQVMLEYKIKMKFHNNDINGTVDCAMVLDNNDIIVIDLKTGRTKVETEDNNQMLMYAYGMIQDLYAQTKKLPNKIIISICQSLIKNTRAVSYTLQQLMDWYISKTEVMGEINSDKLVYRPSVSACKFCQNKQRCNARIKAGVVV